MTVYLAYGIPAPTVGGDANVWGDTVNDDTLALTFKLAAGVETIAIAGNLTLSATNGVDNQARNMGLRFTDGGLVIDPTVTIPGAEKPYIVINETARPITFSAGGTTAVIAAGRWGLVLCNGTDCFSISLGSSADVAAAAASATSAASSAGTATTQKNLATAEKTYAQQWAQNPEDDPVSVAAGGDDATTFSALHWAAKAADQVPLAAAQVTLAADQVTLAAGQVTLAAGQVTLAAGQVALATTQANNAAASAASVDADGIRMNAFYLGTA